MKGSLRIALVFALLGCTSVAQETATQDRKNLTAAELEEQILTWIKYLEIPERRDAVIRDLRRVGAPAVALLRAAAQAEVKRGRTDVHQALLQALYPIEAKRLAGLPVDEAVTIIADYSENRVAVVDATGQKLLAFENIIGAWDAELTPTGTFLISEFSRNRVFELDREGNELWSVNDLKNPYDADRLSNGNTLIADTFNRRVIEVDPEGVIVWSYAKDVHPYDADRLPNGNTLIANVLNDNVIEVDPEGEIVWEVKGVPHVHDADRLPSGNTLLTIRMLHEVREVNAAGETVMSLKNLVSPSDADRLPNGNTLVAENRHVREFNPTGKEVSRIVVTWSVEANRY